MIATRLYPNVKRQIYGLDDWVNVCPGIDVTPMYFAHEGGQERRYYVAVNIIGREIGSARKLFQVSGTTISR